MRFKILVLSVLLIFTTAINAVGEVDGHLLYAEARGQKELKTLKDVHDYNEIFDNYQLGGLPYEPPILWKG